MKNETYNPIDCVIMWVDGNDQEWKKRKRKYALSINERVEDDKEERYREWGTLKYLFRGLDENAKWIRNIYFVTCGQKPEWLNINNPRLRIVNHEEFIPSKYLPTFSSHTIELNLHRIQGLSESFLYLNDDMFILKRTSIRDFFRGNRPCDTAVLNAVSMKKEDVKFRFLMPINNTEIINKHFDKKDVLKAHWRKYYNLKYGKDVLRTLMLSPWIHFTGFVNYHFPYGLRKKSYNEIWDMEYEVLDDTCSHRFRNSNDVNIWLILYWQYVKGDFFPRSPKIGYLSAISENEVENTKVLDYIKNRKYKLIVINDNVSEKHFEIMRKKLIEAFEYIYPDKCSFEI